MLTALKKWLVVILMLFACQLLAEAQQPFIHIQAEAVQAFNASVNGEEYQSNRTGYLVIPEIMRGRYELLISFPAGTWPSYRFPLVITDQPRAFTLKQGIDNSWALFDMVSFSQTAGIISANVPVAQPLAGAPVQPAAGSASVKPATPQVRKIFDKASSGGIDQVYVVINGNRQDTVPLFIPDLELPAPRPVAGLDGVEQNLFQVNNNYPGGIIRLFHPQFAIRRAIIYALFSPTGI